jgi:putative tricarboxylic transport membrane protein
VSETPPTTTTTPPARHAPHWTTGRSELFVAAGVILLAVVLTIGTITMSVPEGTSWPGPQFFPTVVTVILYAVGIALAV